MPEIEEKWPKRNKNIRRNNDLQSSSQKTKDRATRTPLKTVMKLSVCFTSHRSIVEIIMNTIHGQFHVFIQGHGAYKDKNVIFIFTSRCYQNENSST